MRFRLENEIILFGEIISNEHRQLPIELGAYRQARTQHNARQLLALPVLITASKQTKPDPIRYQWPTGCASLSGIAK